MRERGERAIGRRERVMLLLCKCVVTAIDALHGVCLTALQDNPFLLFVAYDEVHRTSVCICQLCQHRKCGNDVVEGGGGGEVCRKTGWRGIERKRWVCSWTKGQWFKGEGT